MAQTEAQSYPSEIQLAKSILASSLVSDEDLDSLLEHSFRDKARAVKVLKKEEVLGTGIKSVDDALGGGLRKGSLVGMSGEVGSGQVGLLLSLLSSHLLDHPTSTAAIIDTTGNFDVLRIYTILASRIRDTSPNTLAISDQSNPEDAAAKVLDRIKIMRVFDLVGVMEAISEIRDGLEMPPVSLSRRSAEGAPRNVEEPKKVHKAVIQDSEDEGEDEDEDEMLFEPRPRSKPILDPEPPKLAAVKDLDNSDADIEGKVGFILIDNIAHVINPLLKNNYVQANALLAALLQRLTHLTHSHSLLTILLNPATTPRPQTQTSTPTAPSNSGYQPQPQNPPQKPVLPPSIFASNHALPALGNLFPMYLDIYLLVSKIPRRKVDARAWYAGDAGMVSVVEVVSERWEGRAGDWGVFVEEVEGGIRNA
ncbi:uncharacterized protein BDR25DRAFT_321491 [Lindgomyces ingoldianus]|uniref:Uncharacterized protein n=1 Tax=Lindgomyces ingoldianus TaxID=673940 RepID=A0ACB6RC91_9PLEO|nr:uncharacterized protein BDR25DRAFT_321491 [Lindgomyces ingoldianus]KAF2476944.1 hypothetical protein BDR25DRAFT_321491 [Lindgomyces ingoldianus]